MKRLIEPVSVWDGANTVLHDAAILIEDGHVTNVLIETERTRSHEDIDDHIDGAGKLAIPGLVNAHTHLYSALARGMAISGFAPTSFAEILEQLWWRLDKALDVETVRDSALAGAMEAARCGVTTLVDHHASPNAIEGSLETIQDVVCNRIGLRGIYCYELTDRDGDARRDQGIAENIRFLSKLDAESEMTAAQFGLHAAFTLSDNSLERVAANLPADAGVHIHVAEGSEDEQQSHERHGVSVIDRLDRFGLLRPKSILAHCLHLSEPEKDRVAERDAIIVHNPRSNMNNAVGLFDLDGYLGRGILTGLGTDGLGCNMLGELFTAGVLQKHSHGDPLAGSFEQLDALLFRGNPDIVERFLGLRVGRIEEEGPADIALIDYIPPTPLDGGNLLGHLLFGLAVHSLRVSDLLVAGRPIIRDGLFVDIDEAAAYAQTRESAARLWKKIV